LILLGEQRRAVLGNKQGIGDYESSKYVPIASYPSNEI